MSEQEFEAAAAAVKAFTQRPTDEELLQLYALYKQAKEGDNATAQPWAVQFEARAKWDAWAAKKGTSKEDARKAYIKLSNELGAKYK